MNALVALIDDAGYIYGSYAVTIITIVAFSAWTLRRGKRLARRVNDDEKYWT